MQRNLRRVFRNDSLRPHKGRQRQRSSYARANEFAKWLEKYTDATHIETELFPEAGHEVSWLEPVKKVR